MVTGRIDDLPREPRRYQYDRHANAEPIEGILLAVVIRRYSRRWEHMISETTVLVIEDHEQCRPP